MTTFFRVNKVLNLALITLLLVVFQERFVHGQTIVQTYTTSANFTVPAGVNSITVECWGGGGAGATMTSNGRGGGGGGGAYAKSILIVNPNDSYSYVVGTGGTNGASGGNSSFGTTLVVAAGGSGVANNTSTGAAGGTVAASTGTTKYAGGDGANGGGTWSGAGGGGAGSTGVGGNATNQTAGLGTADWGGNGGAGINTDANGNAASVYGGGGGGARRTSGSRTGGAGAAGFIRITYTQPFYYDGIGVLNNVASWKTSGGLSPANFTDNNQNFVIKNGQNPTNSDVWTIGGIGSILVLETGASLTETADITINAGVSFKLNAGSVFNHNINSTTVFGGTENFATTSTVNYGFAGIQTVVAGTYGNLIISDSGTKTLDGILNIAGNLQINNSATLDVSATNYALNLAGNFENNSTFTQRSGTVTFNGTTLQTIGGTTSTTFYNFTTNKTSNAITLTSNINIEATLTLTNGVINTGSNTLHVTNTAQSAIFGGSASSHIVGLLIRDLPATASGASTYVFPLGEGSVYKELALLNVVTGTGLVSAQVSYASAGAVDGDFATIREILAHNWFVTKVGNLTSASVRLITPSTFVQIIGISTNTQAGEYVAAGGSGGSASITSPVMTTFPAWFAIGTAIAKTYYSYQNGDWNNSTSWTLDPSGTTYSNPANLYPVSGDYVSILNGKTIVATANIACSFLSIEYGGELDLGSFTGHSLGIVSGSGLMKLNSLSFPLGDFTQFMSAEGGSVECYNISGNLPLPTIPFGVFNNLIISKTDNNATDYNIVGVSNLVLNGNLEIKTTQGTGSSIFTLGNNATLLNLDVKGNIKVGNQSKFSVGGSVLHKITCYGNLENYGTLNFNNNADFSGSTASGAANIIFKGAQDNYVVLNSTTRFFGFAVEKGTDWTNVLSVTSTQATSPFTDSYSGSNAILINAGTIKLGKNINIPRLFNATGNYDLKAEACLWVDGATVQTFGSALVIYGRFRISGGSFNVSSLQRAVVTRFNGELLIEGGTFSFTQFRPSTSVGETPRGSYTQTGGIVNAQGPASSAPYPLFCFPHSETSFTMTGGVINVYDSNNGTASHGGFMIGCTNYQVTGGTLNVYSSILANTNFNINSTVPLWNLNIYAQTSGNKTITVASQTHNIPNITSPTPAKPLVVLNDLKIISGNNPIFSTLGANVTVGGDFIIETNTTYTPGANTTTFNATEGQEFQLNGAISGDFNNLSFTNSTTTVLTGSNTNLTVKETLTIDALCTLEDGGKTINAQKTLFNSGTHSSTGAGKIVLNGTSAQSIYGDGNGIFGNLEINNPNAVTLFANQTIVNTLRLTSGIFDINIYKLNLYNNASNTVVGTFSETCMIRTAGNQSDGGVLKVFADAPNNTFVFPIGTDPYPLGTDGVYSPATITVLAATQGQICVKPVAKVQPFAVGTNNKLERYWNVSSEYFVDITNVSLNFLYPQSEVQGTETDYYAAIYRPFAWTKNNDAGVPFYNDHTNNKIYFTSTQLDGDYTAGSGIVINNAFPASVEVFYSKANGNWFDASTWSYDEDRLSPSSTTPLSNNPVVLGGNGFNHTVSVNGNNAASGSLQLNQGSTLDVGVFTGHNFGVLPNQQVQGTGTLRISSADVMAQFPAGDFGAFIGASGGTVEFYTTTTDFTIPTHSSNLPVLSLDTYFNLNLMPAANTLTMPNSDLTIYNNITVGNDAFTGNVLANSASPKTLEINDSLVINGGSFLIGNNFIQTINVGGNLVISNQNNAKFEVLDANTPVANTLTIYGDIINNGTLNLYNGTRYCHLTFKGNENKSFTGTNPSAASALYSLAVNKGITQSSVLSMNVAGTLTTPTNNWLTLTNGTFSFQKPSHTLVLTDVAGANFLIPATACLSVNNATSVVTIGNNASDGCDLLLSGKLEIKNGTLNIGAASMTNNNHNDIEYASAGTPEISIANGALNVNGQIRNNLSNNAGSLIYNQSGGNVTIYGNNTQVTKSKLMVYNQGSIFNMSGNGTLTIKRAGSTTFSDLYLRPDNSTISGGTIVFDSEGTSANQNFTLDANVPIPNLTIAGITNSSTVNLNVNKLVVLGNLTINTNNTLKSNNLDVEIAGNFTNSGTYNSGANKTIFYGSLAQSITTNTATNFYDFEINKSSQTVSLYGTSDITILNQFGLLSGNLDTRLRNLFVNGSLINNGIHSTNTGIIYLNGTDLQTISGNGNGVFANLTLNNANGVTVNTALTISKQLDFQNGALNIADNLLTFAPTALEPTGISAEKIIITNGVLSDAGVRKIFANGYSGTYKFHIGVLEAGEPKYTPATFVISNAQGTSPALKVRPINSKHPATTDAASLELDYYWNLTTEGNFTATTLNHLYTYNNIDVPTTDNNYLAANLPLGLTVWATANAVNISNNEISFSNNTSIDGDYTAGELTEFASINTYYSRNATLGGNWTDGNSWSITGHDGDAAGSYPQGNPAIIASGHTVTANANNSFSMRVELYGTLDLKSTVGHNYSTLKGNGKMRIEPNVSGAFVFPGGDNSLFMNTENSTIEYVSESGSSISPTITTYQNLQLSGAGTKTLANVDLLIKGNLILQDGIFTNQGYNKNIEIRRHWINNSSHSYLPGLGTVTFNGTEKQLIEGSATLATDGEHFYNLILNNSNQTELLRTITIENDLNIKANSQFVANANTIYIKGNWLNNSGFSFNCNTSTVNFNGINPNQYYSALQNEEFYNLIIGNPNGLTANCTTEISGSVDFTTTLDNRKLTIFSHLLKLKTLTASILNYSNTKLIITNGLVSDAGVVKTVESPYNFTIPLGIANKNTAVTFAEVNASGGSGEITIVPVNGKHPFANNNIVDELQFYWIVDASASITPQQLTHTYTYASSDALPSNAGFVAARFVDDQWDPDGGNQSGTSVGANTIVFSNKNYLVGQYTCGITTNFILLETYYSRDNAPLIASGADWRNLETWSTKSHADNLIINRPNSLPNRNTVIIKTNHKVKAYDNGIRLSNLSLFGELDLGITQDHDFGSITGSGTLLLKNNASNEFALPIATISDFVSAGNGKIVFEGTGRLPNITTYNNLELIGDGNKNMSAVNITINGNLLIQGGVLSNDFNTNIYIKGNWTDNSTAAGFIAGTGTVVFNGAQPQMITAPIGVKSFYNLTVATGSNLTISNKARVTATGTTTIDGTFNLTSSSLGTSSFIDNGIVQTGTANVQRRIYDEVWHYLGLPVTVVDRSKFNVTNFWYFDETVADSWNSTSFASDDKGWTKPTDGNLVANYGAATGFAYRYHARVLNFSGFLNSGNKSTILSYTDSHLGDSYDGWNLLANPYPSALNWDNVDKTNIESAIYYYRDATSASPDAANYATYVDEFAFTNGGTALVPQMQGFFVKAKSNANGQNFTLNNAMRAHPESNAAFYKSASTKTNKHNFLKLNAGKDSLFDEAIIRFDGNATQKYDTKLDAYKLFSKAEKLAQFYSFDNQHTLYSINTNPLFDEQTVIPLGLRVGEAGDYDINVLDFDFPEQTNVYLYDNLTSDFIDLNLQKTYRVSLEKGNHANRFSIRFSKETNSVDEASLDVYSVANQVVVKINTLEEVSGEIKVFDILGKLIVTKQIENQYYFEIPTNTNQGVYIVQVVYNQKSYSKRVYLSNDY